MSTQPSDFGSMTNTTTDTTTDVAAESPAPPTQHKAPEKTGKTGKTRRKQGGGRDRYFDLLRAIALFRVVFYHLMGWAWLPVVFPSMGVMFALAGNLMARSLAGRPALEVVRGRLRRLLPPLWLLGAVGVTGMVMAGWGPDDEGHPGWWWLHLAYWILPLSDPPYGDGLPGVQGLIGDDWAADVGVPLWYIRAYLWFVLLSRSSCAPCAGCPGRRSSRRSRCPPPWSSARCRCPAGGWRRASATSARSARAGCWAWRTRRASCVGCPATSSRHWPRRSQGSASGTP